MRLSLTAAFAAWNRRLPTFGVLAMASFLVAVVTGVLLTIPFDAHAPADSVQLLEIENPAARLLRGMHAWSGHLLLILTLLHALETLLRGAEVLLGRGVWLRVVASVPALLLVMITGFMLKGDAEGQLARQLLEGLLLRLPLVGEQAAASLLGRAPDLQLPYVHHAATATLLCWVVMVEHARRLWPDAASTVGLVLACLVMAAVAPPALHDGLDPVVKGPWYFVGLQEALHWTARPGWFWLAAALALGLLAVLRDLPGYWRPRTRRVLVALLVIYALLSIWAAAFRGAGWTVRVPWAEDEAASSRAPRSGWWILSLAGAGNKEVPKVLGRREGCLVCHDKVTGLAAAHTPAALGCRSCHLGNPNTVDKAAAHDGMVRVPGNLDTAALTCGQPGCHGAIVKRVRTSMMATGVGMVAVNRFVFGETKTPDGTTPLSGLGDSPADVHLKGLCIKCHLGTLKQKPAPTSEMSRGGGCTACHLGYAPKKQRYHRTRAEAFAHPALTVQISDDRCFGCHSRSGRISLNYAGWSETLLEPGQVKGRRQKQYRVLADGRVLQRQTADVHHRRKMACVDCHTSREAMGDGASHKHQEQATEVSCVDCHPATAPRTAQLAQLDAESRAVLELRARRRGEKLDPGARYVLAARGGRPLVNVTLGPMGVVVRGKLDGRRWRPRRPVGQCGAGISGHQRLSCQSCHSAWAPQCISCHTQYVEQGATVDPRTGQRHKGRFVEYQGQPRAGPPPLGVRKTTAGVLRGAERIEPFVPGMIMTLNKDRGVPGGKLPDSADRLIDGKTIFRRLYAPSVPHTTTHKGRSCASCHRSSLALGLGRGKLTLDTGGAKPAWRFSPAVETLPQDGLPADAWIPWGRARTDRHLATRANARPFTQKEQHRVLRVGACLPCHDPATPAGQAIYRDFDKALDRVSPRCVIPAAR